MRPSRVAAATTLAILIGLGVMGAVGVTDALAQNGPRRGAWGRADRNAQPAPDGAGYVSKAPTHQVRTELAEWHDQARSRKVPIKAYIPAGAEPEPGGWPLVVFSHGGGGSRQGGTYLGEYLASRGYVVIAPQHAGSDIEAVRGSGRGLRKMRENLLKLASDERNLIVRPQDVSFVIDRALADGLPGVRIDQGRLGVMGHSFGAYTTMALGGMRVDAGGERDRSFRDARVGALLALSPQGQGQFGVDAGAWDDIDTPVVMLTGTKDSGNSPSGSYTWRTEPFKAIKARGGVPAYLGVITGAGHMAFADETNALLDGLMGGRDPRFHGWIGQVALATFDAFLRRDDDARAWLDAGGITAATGGQVSWETAGTRK